jgi:hypothetical protein
MDTCVGFTISSSNELRQQTTNKWVLKLSNLLRQTHNHIQINFSS